MLGATTFSRWRTTLAVLATLAVVVGIAISFPSSGASRSVPCGATPVGGTGDFTVNAGSMAEPLNAIVHVPVRLRGRPLPLLLAFHGSGGTGPFMRSYSGLARLADQKGFAVAFPTSPVAKHTWQLNADNEPDRDDVGAVRGLLDQIQTRSCIDTKRVFAAGVSNGGGFTARLGCDLADRISGIVVVAGGFSQLGDCKPARPVSVLEIHGTADHVVPYDGKPETDYRGAVRPWLTQWAKRDGCQTTPVKLAPRGPGVERLRWPACKDGTRVQHIAVYGGRHAWPGATPPDPGPSPINASQEAWAFLSQLKPR